tara:strand:- start:1539 stop:2072 length:534 start_codon:yes stop_codon:yes gene_type:complete
VRQNPVPAEGPSHEQREKIVPKFFVLFWIVLLNSVIPVSTHGKDTEAPVVSNAAAEKEIRALLHKKAEAIIQMSIEGVEELIAVEDNYSIVEGRHANWSWAEYRDTHLRPEFTSPDFKITAYEIGDIKVTIGEDLAFAVYDYVIKAEVKGKKLSKKNYTTVVLKRTSRGWRILHEHS